MNEQQDTLFTDMPDPGTVAPPIHVTILDLSKHPNRCVREWGLGPEGKTCGDCVHLEAWRWSKVYFKCAKRLEKHGGDTDRRKYFAACSRFEQRTEEVPTVFAKS